MDSNIKASFIPDKIVSNSRGAGMRESGEGIGDFLILIGVVALAVSIALAVGVFLYDKFLSASVQQKNASLQKAYNDFEPSLVQKLVRVDARINAATVIMNRHMAPSALFVLLEKLTLKSISYKSLNYSINDNGIIKIAMKGVARSVNGVALQASVFGKYKGIENSIFSNINIKNDGVTFDVSADLDPRYMSYQTVIQQEKSSTNISDMKVQQSTNKGNGTSTSTTNSGVGFGSSGDRTTQKSGNTQQ